MSMAYLVGGMIAGFALAVFFGIASGSFLVGLAVYGFGGATAVLGLAALCIMRDGRDFRETARTPMVPAE